MTKQEELKALYEQAREKGLCASKTEFAQLLGIRAGSLSHALAGTGGVSTENTVLRARRLLASASGDGSVQNVVGSTIHNGVPVKNFEACTGWFNLVAEKDKQIDRLLAIIERMQS